MGTHYFLFFFRRFCTVALLSIVIAAPLFAADKPELPTTTGDLAPPKTPAENPAEAQQAMRAYIQEQLQQTVVAIEQNRKNSEAAAQQNAEKVEARLNGLERALTRQHDQDAAMARDSSRFALIVAASLGLLGVLVMVLTGWFLMRTARQFSEIAAFGLRPAALGHGAPWLRTALGAWAPNAAALLAESQSGLSADISGNSGGKLLGAIERLEKRIHDIEHTTFASHPSPQAGGADHKNGNGSPDDPKVAQTALLLGKGQSLLHLDQPENAIASFDEVLTLDPANTEALVKKGTALEKLKRLEDAIACYDRAISVDDSMTLAYLYKGGVFNQLERFSEALQCYEKALRAQQKLAMSSAS